MWPCALGIFFVTMSALSAAEIANTTGKGDWGGGAAVGPFDHGDYAWAVSVTPPANYRLTSISIPLSVVKAPGVVTVTLADDDHGSPGLPIEIFTITVTDLKPKLQTVKSTKHPRLLEDTPYWISVSAAGPTRATWYNTADNPPPRGCKVALSFDRTSWAVQDYRFQPPGLIVSGDPIGIGKVARVTGQSYPRVLP